jgi:1,4-dihydroxy-2-naphthoate octaprenyltransferase
MQSSLCGTLLWKYYNITEFWALVILISIVNKLRSEWWILLWLLLILFVLTVFLHVHYSFAYAEKRVKLDSFRKKNYRLDALFLIQIYLGVWILLFRLGH